MIKNLKLFFAIFIFATANLFASTNDYEIYTYSLSESTASYALWTAPPSVRIFKDDIVPTNTDSGIKVYAAKNEFEPFVVVVKPASSGNISVSLDDFGGGITAELFQVKYVNITQVSEFYQNIVSPEPVTIIGCMLI